MWINGLDFVVAMIGFLSILCYGLRLISQSISSLLDDVQGIDSSTLKPIVK